jgi:RNA-binding protein Musashi
MAPTMPQAAASAVQQMTATQTPNQQPQNPQLTTAAATAAPQPYPGYNLASIDMTSFNGIDWSSMYGMYV